MYYLIPKSRRNTHASFSIRTLLLDEWSINGGSGGHCVNLADCDEIEKYGGRLVIFL